MFCVNYSLTTGTIVSYQGGEDDSQNLPPEGCGTLKFKDNIPQMFDANFNLTMKVDVATRQLVYINPVQIPQPLSEK